MAITTSPNVSEIPTCVMPPPVAALMTIAPVPAKTRAKVPTISASSLFSTRAILLECLSRCVDCEIFEIACTVRFRPQANFAGNWWTQNRVIGRKQVGIWRASGGRRIDAQRVFQRESSVEIGLEIGSVHRELQLMPGVSIELKWFVPVAEP